MSLKSYFEKGKIEVACDEAGRGCLAGPVFAAAVILDQSADHPDLNDSKKLNQKKRAALESWIKSNALAWSVQKVDADEIDEINILQASFLAMHRSLDQIKKAFDSILVDGNRFVPYREVPHHCIIKGDGKYQSIAAASILAKEARDKYMGELAEKYPQYAWEKNFGYPTKQHRAAIKKYGISPFHRKSFQLLPPQLKLNI